MRRFRRTTAIIAAALATASLLAACSPTDEKPRTGPAALGSWDTIDIPEDLQINAIHSVMLPTGDVLLIAGSGNNAEQFAAGTFETLIYSPETGEAELIDTPEDLFCGGHAHLPNGNVLVAGGTQAYEVAPKQLTHAGGVLTLVNETPQKEFFVPRGSEVIGEASGQTFITDSDITIPAAVYDETTDSVTASQRNVYVSAVLEGEAGAVKEDAYHVIGMTGDDALNLHGYAQSLGFEKKDYQGIDSAYEFDPWQRAYIKVDSMNYARWYPTLTAMSNGHILTLSGLDASGKVLDGQTEIYNPETKTWTDRPDLTMMFPTYPSVFQTAEEGIMFSAGINQGWGPAEEGRDPGFWDLSDNSFTTVPGLRDPELNETGAVGWLGPVNDQRLIVVGGGSVGDTPTSTGRIDVIDLGAENPRFEALADLPQGTRYPNIVTLPSGDVFVTNGSTGYRGQGGTDILKSYLLSQEDGKLTELASPSVGRNYHSSALLLPNGQVLVAGSDPLFADAANTVPGKFEKRIEIYTPPYLFNEEGKRADRPVIDRLPEQASYGQPIDLDITSTHGIAKVRLLYPGAVTHVTDTNQRLVELEFEPMGNGVRAIIPKNPSLVPPAHYMVVVIDDQGVPSEAQWIHIGQEGAADASHPTSGHNH